jgi:hypothetical protein
MLLLKGRKIRGNPAHMHRATFRFAPCGLQATALKGRQAKLSAEILGFAFQASNHFFALARVDPFVPPHDGEHCNQCRRAIEQRKCGCAHARHQVPLVIGIALFANLRDQPVDGGVVACKQVQAVLRFEFRSDELLGEMAWEASYIRAAS